MRTLVKSVLIGVAALTSAAAAAEESSGTGASGTFVAVSGYWNDGMSAHFKIEAEIAYDGESFSYRGLNLTNPDKPVVTNEFSGALDAVKRPADGMTYDSIVMRGLLPNEIMIEKYRGPRIHSGEFWHYDEASDQWLRHGVVSELPNGMTRTYYEIFKRKQ